MPELPEVETIRREITRRIVGKFFASVEIRVPKMVSPPVARFASLIRGKKILAIGRHAKMLTLSLSGKKFLVFHLKMTGQLVFVPQYGKTVSGGHPIPNVGVLPNKFSHVIFHFRDGSTLYFNDQRKFGWVKLVDDGGLEKMFAPLGVEPLSKDFSWEKFSALVHRYPNRMIKQVITDNALMVGVGNIYADESCFCARVRPTRRARSLRLADVKKLYRCIPRVLKFAIGKKGTTSDAYRRPDGRDGNMLAYLKVYGRKGKPCRRCKTPIVKTVVGQRGTHYCPRCQR
ncbi:MAG: DNA-formamidopyrimidine glycosylase [Patescibacteria group bacterium]|nr:DNA-formamidopyrimidine glycosylase [Patescibacteria group bacterium]